MSFDRPPASAESDEILARVRDARAQTVVPALWAAVVLSLVMIVATSGRGMAGPQGLVAVGYLGLCVVGLIDAARDHVRRAAWTFVGATLAVTATTAVAWSSTTDAAGGLMVPAVVVAATLLGRPGLVAALGVTAFTLCGIVVADAAGVLPAAHAAPTTVLLALTHGLCVAMVAIMAFVGERSLVSAVSEGSLAEAELERSRFVDETTGLLSRAGLRAELQTVLTDPDADCSIVILGLEDYSLLKSALGLDGSDVLLAAVGARLSECLRGADLLARGDADEFVALIRDAGGAPGAWHVAERLHETLRLPFTTGESEVTVRATTAVVPLEGLTGGARGVLRQAEAGLHAARRISPGGVAGPTPSAADSARASLSVDARLRRAIAEERIVPYFQPIVHLGDGELSGFEALARWIDAETGKVVPPNTFIPRAEETGLVVDIDRAVLRAACRQLRDWTDEYEEARRLYVGVNLSTRQFATGDLVQFVAAALDEFGLEPWRLHLEITEGSLAGDLKHTRGVLEDLRELGVVLLVDDFGTGWSSLSYLQHLPVDHVKIDRSFVQEIHAGGGDALPAAILAMARSMGIGAVAEGIETRDQYRRLRALGCPLGQGYHFSRPLPADQVPNCFERRSADVSAAWSLRRLTAVKRRDRVT